MSSHTLSFDLQYHVLNFFYDAENSCALTALIGDVRYHIIADASKVRKGGTGQEYSRLLQAVKDANIDELAGESSDSGVDVSHDEKDDDEDVESVHGATGAEENLHRWMLAPLSSIIDDHETQSEHSKDRTLKEWYTGPIHFFELSIENKQLQATELQSTVDLERRLEKLLHQISIPKYISDIDIPWFQASELTVEGGSNSPPPYHPAQVRTENGQQLFLKLVDRDQPQPTKREIFHLHKIAEEGLHEKLRCPRLEGLVTFTDDRTKIMGFLQSDIPNPSPLTTKLDTDVPQDLRDRWATESRHMVDTLHEHGIVWGDAKADNFLVDENDELWIIDFGGSYTEGWVDPELNETAEGDDMGVEKIVNALHDPVHNTWDPDTEPGFGGASGEKEKELEVKGKRKAADMDYEESPPTKRSRRTSEDAMQVYCYCNEPDSGQMIACDGLDCEREWFHFECVGLSEAPGEDETWYCDECSANQQHVDAEKAKVSL